MDKYHFSVCAFKMTDQIWVLKVTEKCGLQNTNSLQYLHAL